MLAVGLGIGLGSLKRVLGPEICFNGGFGVDANWIKGAGWTISGGVAVATNATASLYEAGKIPKKGIYLVKYTVLNYASGNVRAVCGDSDEWAVYSSLANANGSYAKILYPSAAGDFAMVVNAFTGQVDNVSIKEIVNAY